MRPRPPRALGGAQADSAARQLAALLEGLELLVGSARVVCAFADLTNDPVG